MYSACSAGREHLRIEDLTAAMNLLKVWPFKLALASFLMRFQYPSESSRYVDSVARSLLEINFLPKR